MSEFNEIDRRQVNITQIRDELNQMWAAQAHEGETVLRAATHNLIVFVSDSAAAARTTDRVIELTASRPGRVILVDVEPGTEDRLDAWVSIYCRPSGDRQVCGELITLAVQGGLRDAVDTSVIALLASDLPVYLWWIGELDQDDRLFQRLSRSVSRVIVDSASFSNTEAALATLAGLPHDLRLSDLAWARLTPWRRTLARLWDAPGLAESLHHIRAVHVDYTAEAAPARAEQALLLVGWLADRLGWQLKAVSASSPGTYHTQWRRGTWEGVVTITPHTGDALPVGEIYGLSIEADPNAPLTELRVTAVPEADCVETHAITRLSESIHAMHALQAVSTSMALAEELDYGFDPYYPRALAQAAQIVRRSSAPTRKPGP